MITSADLDRHLRTLPPEQRRPPDGQPLQPWLEERLFEVFSGRVLANTTEAEEAARAEAFELDVARAVDQQLARRWLQRHNAEFELTSEEIAAEFERFAPQMRSPERRVFRSLYLAAGEAELDERCDEAGRLAERARGGESFAALVREHSESANARIGGQVGPVERSQLRGEAARVVFALDQGEISHPVRTPNGCFVFFVEQIHPAIEPELALVQSDLAQMLAERKRAEWKLGLVRDAAEETGIELPEWLAQGRRPDLSAMYSDAVVLETGERAFLGRELVQMVRRSGPEEGIDRLQASVLAAAFARSAPDVASVVQEQQRRAQLTRAAQEALFERAVAEAPADELEALYAERRDELLTDARIELQAFLWPIQPGEPTRSLARPQEFLAAVTQQSDPDTVDRVWERLGAGGRTVSLPETAVRELERTTPQLKEMLATELTEGAWLGPHRMGNEIAVARIVRYLEPRQLSYVEASSRLRQLWFEQNRESVETSLRQELGERFGFVVRQVRAETLGELLAAVQDSGQGAGEVPANPDAP